MNRRLIPLAEHAPGGQAHPRTCNPDAQTAVTLRLVEDGGDERLVWLAQMDSAEPLLAPVLVAERAGRPSAAISLTDGRVIANPFEPTVAVVELLKLGARAPESFSWQRSGVGIPRRANPTGRAPSSLVGLQRPRSHCE
jgi:hypothetical protein